MPVWLYFGHESNAPHRFVRCRLCAPCPAAAPRARWSCRRRRRRSRQPADAPADADAATDAPTDARRPSRPTMRSTMPRHRRRMAEPATRGARRCASPRCTAPATTSSCSTCATARRRRTPALAAQLADRHIGVGCDQILTIEPPRSAGAVASYRIWNADGSPSQQCGNGARCVAAWLVRDGAAPGARRFRVDSPPATHEVERLRRRPLCASRWACREFAPARDPAARASTRAQDGYDARRRRRRRIALRRGVDGQSACGDRGGRRRRCARSRHSARRCSASAAFPQSVNVGFAAGASRATACACACSSAASARRWPAAAAPARRWRC